MKHIPDPHCYLPHPLCILGNFTVTDPWDFIPTINHYVYKLPDHYVCSVVTYIDGSVLGKGTYWMYMVIQDYYSNLKGTRDGAINVNCSKISPTSTILKNS